VSRYVRQFVHRNIGARASVVVIKKYGNRGAMTKCSAGFPKLAKQQGIGVVLTHSMRHTYRSWLDAVGTSVAVQQRLMRHADIRTTMNVYGDIVTDEVKQASGKVAGLALTDRVTDRNDRN
jgi:integrase